MAADAGPGVPVAPAEVAAAAGFAAAPVADLVVAIAEAAVVVGWVFDANEAPLRVVAEAVMKAVVVGWTAAYCFPGVAVGPVVVEV